MITVDRLLADDFNADEIEKDFAESVDAKPETSTKKTNQKKPSRSKQSSNNPWSIKGVSQEARAVAKKQAAAAGVNMGEWLTQAIFLGASGSANIAQSTETLPAQKPAEHSSAPQAMTQAQLAKLVLQLAERLNTLEKDHIEANTALTGKIETLRRYMAS